MSDKSPRQNKTQGTGKSLKQKRAEKRDAGNATPIIPPTKGPR